MCCVVACELMCHVKCVRFLIFFVNYTKVDTRGVPLATIDGRRSAMQGCRWKQGNGAEGKGEERANISTREVDHVAKRLCEGAETGNSKAV